MKSAPLVIERILEASAGKVWRALTDRQDMQKWYFDIADFKPEIGFEFQFAGGSDTKTYLHLCRVTEAVAGKKLAYSWRYDGYEGKSFVTFELFDEGDKTRLKLTHSGLETFPSDNSDFAVKNFAEGWTEIIGVSLKKFVETK